MSVLDVLVVGAGPAGTIAAAVLARAGLRVRMLDRARFPRPKLCGDTLNPGAFALLERLDRRGLAPGIHHTVQARALPVAGMTLSGPDGATLTADYPDGLRGLAISRSRFDQLLVDAACSAGVDLAEGVRAVAPIVEDDRVTGIHLAGRSAAGWRARFVVIADGRGSRLASALQLSRFAARPRRWAFGAYFSDVADVSARGEMHLRRDGYIGIAPLPGGLSNVCVVRHAGGHRRHAFDQRTIIAATIGADPWLRDRVTAARQQSDVRVLGPLAIDARAAGCPGAVLAGDVAGFVDPMTGDGLRFAIAGGMLAAEAVLAEISNGRPAAATLARARRRAFAAKYRFNRVLRAMAGAPRSLSAASWLTERWSAPAEWLVRVAGDVQQARRSGEPPEGVGTVSAASRAS